MKGSLIITIGMSNSGKSTWAAKKVQEDPRTYIRINRDDIRSLLFGYTDETVADYYKRTDLRQLEKQVTRFEDSLIYDALELGKTVIVDATHLKRNYLERFKYWNVPVTLEIFGITVSEALERDSKRTRKVGEEVIRKQFAQFKQLVKELESNPIDFTPLVLENEEYDGISDVEIKPTAYIVDIDGTLADKNDRNPFDWFKVGHDTVRNDLAPIIRHLGHMFDSLELPSEMKPKIIIATGRDGVCLPDTEQWLEQHGIPYDEIYIRPKGDTRPDWLIKQEMAQDIVKNNYIAVWFDDRLQVTRHLRMLGLNVYNVAHGNF
jgi:predicted kinase